MEVELRRHDHKYGKAGWKASSIYALRRYTDAAMASLRTALNDNSTFKVIQQCADVANYCMMMADQAGGIPGFQSTIDNSMTGRQLQVLMAIKEFQDANRGRAPTYREIAKVMEYEIPKSGSVGAIQNMLKNLSDMGFVRYATKSERNMKPKRKGDTQVRPGGVCILTKLGRRVFK
jgi:hypothetical protein